MKPHPRAEGSVEAKKFILACICEILCVNMSRKEKVDKISSPLEFTLLIPSQKDPLEKQWFQFSLFQCCETSSGVGYEKCVNANWAIFSDARLGQSSIGIRNLTIIWTNLISFSVVPGFKTGLCSILKFKHPVEKKPKCTCKCIEKTNTIGRIDILSLGCVFTPSSPLLR